MKNIFTALILLHLGTYGLSQLTYEEILFQELPKATTIDFDNQGPDYRPSLQLIEGPSQTPKRLQRIKEISARKFPKQYNLTSPPTKRLSDPPENLGGFDGNTTDGSDPEDNHLAISNDGQVISVVNSSIGIYNENGDFIRERTLASFTAGLSNGLSKFDPRIIYDPENDKFIFTCLAGSNSNSTNVIIGFSETNDATGTWNMYEITGNPRGDDTWTDYPMISITENELFLTGNLIFDGIPWQTGFSESLVYQINKYDGYNGEPLNLKLWNNIEYNGKPIRNLYPVKSGGATLSNRQYFLSNRNFALSNDTIFVLEVTGELNSQDAELIIDVRTSDTEYGAPPVANQPQGNLLETNDARILDGYLLDDRIHFVGNTVNQTTGFADVYHGTVNNVMTDKLVTANLLGNSNVEYGYPAMSWTGDVESDDECIIIVNHTAVDKNPGITAYYYQGSTGYSDPVEVREGRSYMDQLGNRWGDYAGCQRKYNEPGIVFTSASYGGFSNSALTYINKISKPQISSSTESNDAYNSITRAYPNPTYDYYNLSFEVNKKEVVTIELYDAQGRLVEQLYKDYPKKIGLLEFSFSTIPLSNGTYYLRTIIGNNQMPIEKLVKVSR